MPEKPSHAIYEVENIWNKRKNKIKKINGRLDTAEEKINEVKDITAVETVQNETQLKPKRLNIFLWKCNTKNF